MSDSSLDLRMSSSSPQSHLNFALVESVRPEMYTAMKYWGKKPHNIWSQFIECYTPEGGVVIDPFVGSGIAAFEAAKLGRKAIAFDLNPISTFLIEVLTNPFDEARFLDAFAGINKQLEEDTVYRRHFLRQFEGRTGVVSNYRWNHQEVVKVALEIDSPRGKDRKSRKAQRYFIDADEEDKAKATEMLHLSLPFWYPTREFPTTSTFPHSFIRGLGGNSFANLWTRRNLYLLSRLFSLILKETDETVRLQLLFGFIQTLHLTSKMVVPRNTASKRDFSGSWGRADYMIRRRSMEQNPLVVFARSCVGKQGVTSALLDAQKTLPRSLSTNNVRESGKLKGNVTINYGHIDVADLDHYVGAKSVDFALTDPPYAGLVQYLELSLVWLVWLEHVRQDYWPDLDAEITLKKGQRDREAYRRRLENAFRQLHIVLKDNGYLVVTFHHKRLLEWNDFVKAVRLAGFTIDKVTHQYNRRSGEANVANPYGTSGADFYIRCVKHRDVDFTDDTSGLEHFVLQKAIEIIGQRNEPTPYDFLVAGVLPEMLQAGYTQPSDYKNEIDRILRVHVGPGKTFTVSPNTSSKAGDYWWFANPIQYIAYPDRPLRDRVEETVLSILRRKVAVRFDDVLGQLFQNYPNGLTPDPREIRKIIELYAVPSAGKWKIKPSTIIEATVHSKLIEQLATIGKRAKYLVSIGKREQPELGDVSKILRELSDTAAEALLRQQYNPVQLSRIQMVDVLWTTPAAVRAVFEVENTTGFSSAIIRASNLQPEIPKFMVIPDARETELLALRDPLFVSAFAQNNWRYVTYSSIERLQRFSSPSIEEVTAVSKTI